MLKLIAPEVGGDRLPARPKRKPYKRKETTAFLQHMQDVATGVIPPERARKCVYPMVVKDPETKKAARNANGEVIRLLDADGKQVYCDRWAIAGGTVCPKHGGSAPQVKARAAQRLLAEVDSTISRMVELRDQDEHMPTAFAAGNAILNRALGKADSTAKDQASKAPTINIGFALGGIPAGQRPELTGVTIATPPTAPAAIDIDPDDDFYDE